ncbi:MAG: RsmE family RNA methyltransferase [Planctomycetes bacterium]|nr:RsmE family RNA methyltransferase [Planctomycetota bacterium]
MPARERSERCFFLDPSSTPDAPRLCAEDEEHLRRVLRAEVGDRVTGLDGRGLALELVVTRVERREVALEAVGLGAREPEPGTEGAPLDWLEVAAPLPRGERAEQLVDRLVQLGVASLVPLEAERTQGGRGELGEGRRARLERLVRAACKQSRRAWQLELAPETSFERWLAERERRVLWCADPRASETLLAAAAELPRAPRGTRERPLALAVGPEGGWTDAERDAARAAGAREVALGPHVQRIETAAEAAAACVAQVRWLRSL